MKRNRLAMSAACLFLVLVAGPSGAAEGAESRTSFSTPAGRVSLVVAGSPDAEWTRWVASETERFVAAVERWTGVPFRAPREIRIEGAKEVWFTGANGVRRKTGGLNDGKTVRLAFDLARVGEPWLLFHELGHYWYGSGDADSPDAAWFVEGLVSGLAEAMTASGMFGLDERASLSIANAWGRADYELWDHDYPLATDRRFEAEGKAGDAVYSVFYVKSYKAVWMARALAGPSAFRDACRRLLADRGWTKGNAAVLSAFAAAAPGIDWRKALSGWVTEGPYRGPSWRDFADPDLDGARTVDEFFAGTDPARPDTDGDLAPDGWELARGTDPLRPDPRALVQAAVRERGPWADGALADWDLSPWIETFERAGEGEAWDMERCLSMSFGDVLVVAVTGPAGVSVPRGERIMADLLVDLDADGKADLEYVAWTARADRAWRWDSAKAASSSVPGLVVAPGACLEFRVPLEGLPDRFRFLPIVRDDEAKRNLAEWDRWIEYEGSTHRAYRALDLRGDPRRLDRDGDGIPDRDEAEAGLDLLKADPPSVVRALGPFVDGNPRDWRAFDAPFVPDARGDGAAADLLGFSWVFAGERLVFRVDVAMPWRAARDLLFALQVDANGDGKPDVDWSFYLDRPAQPWVWNHATSTSTAAPSIAAAVPDFGAAEGCFEMSVPRAMVPGGPFRAYPIVWDGAARKLVDAPDGGWIAISPP